MLIEELFVFKNIFGLTIRNDATIAITTVCGKLSGRVGVVAIQGVLVGSVGVGICADVFVGVNVSVAGEPSIRVA